MAHALPLRNEFLREHSTVLAASVALHLLLLVLLSLNLEILPRRQPAPSRLAIQATVVDARTLRQASAREDQRQREALQRIEQRRQETLERQQREQAKLEAEQQRVATENKLAEQKRQEQAEAQRREETRRADEAARTAAATKAKAEQQRKESEQQKLAAAEAQKQADAERRKAQTKADLARQMAEEEDLEAAADSGELDQYLDVIRQKVRRNWTEPASARAGDSCDVKVQQIPGGEIVSAVAVNCSGDAAFARSVEVAVLRSSPLPLPTNPRLFERNLLFNFKPEQ